jgi:hypothetical protein
MILPVPLARKRFAAALRLLSFGIGINLFRHNLLLYSIDSNNG